ncbi:MAG TPA: chorismate synthase [Bacteroidota bacterium]|nr:chorismate synthase [Bacteroidota bacterium]
MIRYFTAGESHGKALVGVVEGIPAGVPITAEYINHQLWRRQQGFGRGARMRIESDEVEILSGVRFGKTLGTPVSMVIHNADSPKWEKVMDIEGAGKGVDRITIPRPGHADYAGALKYGYDDIRNAIERSSARETAMRVACCTIPRKLLEEYGIFIGSHVVSIGSASAKDRRAINSAIAKGIRASCAAYKVTELADKSEVRMLDADAASAAINQIQDARKRGDTLGGIFEIIVTGLPVGLGSYVQSDRRLDGQLAQALMSIQAVKGVEVGDGFRNAVRPGSEVHDEFQVVRGKVARRTNNAGGLEGGITNGEMLVLHAAMKPISTLANPLKSIDLRSRKAVKARYERSDVCAVPACSVIGEAAIAPVLANAFLEKFGGDSTIEISRHYRR